MCASRSRSVLVRQVFYLFIDQTVYPRAVSPTRAPVKFPSGFLARKVKGTAPNPSRTRPHERLFRMRALAAYVYTVAEFQSAVEQGIYKKKGKRERQREVGEGGGKAGLVFACVYAKANMVVVIAIVVPLAVRTPPCGWRNTSPHRTNL